MKANRRARKEATQLFRFCMIDGVLDEGRARQVSRQIAATRSHDSLGVLSYFLRLARLDEAKHTATIETPAPLSADSREGVRASLARTYKPAPKTTFSDEPALIGGMRIQVGSDVYDGSVRGRLAALERSF